MSPLLPTAWNLPAWITMMELSIGGRPVPSISFPPCTTSVCSATMFPSRVRISRLLEARRFADNSGQSTLTRNVFDPLRQCQRGIQEYSDRFKDDLR